MIGWWECVEGKYACLCKMMKMVYVDAFALRTWLLRQDCDVWIWISKGMVAWEHDKNMQDGHVKFTEKAYIDT